MCRKRTRGWDDGSSVGSSDSNESDAEDVIGDGQRGGSDGSEGQRGDSDRSEGGGSEGGNESDGGNGSEGGGSEGGNESDGGNGSEGGVSSTDDHFGSQELHEIHEHVDAEWSNQ